MVLAITIASCTHAPPPAQTVEQSTDSIQRFVVRSDTQYPRTDFSSDDPAESERLLNLQNRAINAWRSQYGGSIPVFLNGDITEFGHGKEWTTMFRTINATSPTYWGLGNHDYENNVGDCANNGCARDSLNHLKDAVADWGVDAFEYATNDDGDRHHTGSYAYSKTIGNIKFIQLNNHFNYAVEFSTGIIDKTYYHIHPSLRWLEREMVSAEKKGNYIVINLHRQPSDSSMGSEADRKKFYDLVRDHRVLAIFHGHTHIAALRGKIGDTEVFDSGASFKKTFLTAAVDESKGTMSVYIASDNAVDPMPLKTVPLKILPPLPKIGLTAQAGGNGYIASIVYMNRPRDTRIASAQISLDNGPFKDFNFSDHAGYLYGLEPNTGFT